MANRERFQILADYFRRIADGKDKTHRASMDYWMAVDPSILSRTQRNIMPAKEAWNLCGTSGCIYGVGVALFDPDVMVDFCANGTGMFVDSRGMSVDEKADGWPLFGISYEEADLLFYPQNWNEKYQGLYEADRAGTMAEICQRIADGEKIYEILGWTEEDMEDE